MTPENGPTVSYPVKDLLDNLGKEISRGFDDLKHQMEKLDMKIEQKASIERVVAVEKSVADLELRHDIRIKALELMSSGESAVSTLKDKWTFAAIGFVATIIGAIIYLASGVH